MNFRFSLIPVLSFLLTLTLSASLQGQGVYSLSQAIDYAYNNNYSLKNAAYDVEIARRTVKENTSIGLPQVSGNAGYTDFIQLPTSLLPGEFNQQNPGQPLEVQFGSKYNLEASLEATQLVYSGQYLVGLQTARAYLEAVKQSAIKSKASIRDQVTNAYIGCLILDESVSILDSTLRPVSQMVNDARQAVSMGLLEETEAEQLALNQSDLEARIITLKNQKEVALFALKFLMGIEDNQPIRLTDNVDDLLGQIDLDYLINNPFDYRYNIDYLLFMKQDYLVKMQYKLAKTAYQPTLLAFFSYAQNAQRREWNFFQGDQPWFNTVNWGITLNVPIWSSGQRYNSVQKAKLNVEKMKNNEKQLKTSLNLAVETAKTDFNNSYLIFLNKKQALATSSKIYNQMMIKYSKGIVTGTDLNQRYQQFLLAEQAYFSAMNDLFQANTRLKQLLEKF